LWLFPILIVAYTFVTEGDWSGPDLEQQRARLAEAEGTADESEKSYLAAIVAGRVDAADRAMRSIAASDERITFHKRQIEKAERIAIWRLQIVGFLLSAYTGPVMLLYFVGWTVNWIRVGFRGRSVAPVSPSVSQDDLPSAES
jgi:hypothetical protein